jgi:hypothetical protein
MSHKHTRTQTHTQTHTYAHKHTRARAFVRWGVVSTSPNPQAGGPPHVGCLLLLIQYFLSYLPYWRPFLHPQPEDAPLRGDRNPLIMYSKVLTPWSRVIVEKLTGLQLVKNFPAFYGTRKFITAFTSARHLSLSWSSSIQSLPPHPTSWRSALILSSHLTTRRKCAEGTTSDVKSSNRNYIPFTYFLDAK